MARPRAIDTTAASVEAAIRHLAQQVGDTAVRLGLLQVFRAYKLASGSTEHAWREVGRVLDAARLTAALKALDRIPKGDGPAGMTLLVLFALGLDELPEPTRNQVPLLPGRLRNWLNEGLALRELVAAVTTRLPPLEGHDDLGERRARSWAETAAASWAREQKHGARGSLMAHLLVASHLAEPKDELMWTALVERCRKAVASRHDQNLTFELYLQASPARRDAFMARARETRRLAEAAGLENPEKPERVSPLRRGKRNGS